MGRLLTRRRFLTGLIAAPILTGLYTWRIEPHWLELVRRDLPIAGLPGSLVGKTLVQLSDIHIGPQVDDSYVLDVFRQIAALNPDIVVHTGDLVTYARPKVLDQARSLTRREREVLGLVHQGLTNQEIAGTLVIELGTVKNHMHNILRKLKVNSRRDAVHVSRLAGLWGSGEPAERVILRRPDIRPERVPLFSRAVGAAN